MPSKSVKNTNQNQNFEDIFDEKKVEEPQKKEEETNSNAGFFLNGNDIKAIEEISDIKSDLIANAINTESIKKAFIKIGFTATNEEVSITDSCITEIRNQANEITEQLGNDNFKKNLPGRSQQLQITGYQAS